MTEADWDSCTDPMPMLEWLLTAAKPSDRKLRLFACACHRRVRHWAGDDNDLNRAVDLMERCADGPVVGLGPEAIEQAEVEMIGPAYRGWRSTPWVENAASYAGYSATWLEWQMVEAAYDATVPGRSADLAAARAARDLAETAHRRALAAERGEQCSLLRDLFGNPFRPLPPLGSALLNWNGGAVMQLARAAYEERILPEGHLDPARLAVLADALEEAGAPEEVLAHLRAPGPHVRGCWAVDYLLGKS